MTDRVAVRVVGLVLRGLFGTLYCLTSASVVQADEPVPSMGIRRALIVCGHPGDAEHAQRYAEVMGKIVHSLTQRLGFDAPHVTVLAGLNADEGNERFQAEWPAATQGPATRDALTAAVERLQRELQPEDTLWVIVVGHAHHDGRLTWLNLPGPDLHHNDFGQLWKGVTCREQVFLLTTPASGYFTRSLSAKGRVVITATEADYEVNETLAPEALAEVLNPTAETPLADVDGDGHLTLFDLYVELSRNVARRYLAETLLATEHGLLDDNGDGRGTELQRDYLTEEEGGRFRKGVARSVSPPISPGRDGAVAVTIRLPLNVPASATVAPTEKESAEATQP